ncbi:putative nuclear migration protein (ApsA) [Aspergillus ruber CBS 135680]|uniref:PH domain-containing protein n=1 Tax=Aspergillus ruber (strain CBS 135680) TaxID=1388766 RepID=A0A017S8Y3_ASPRC|nr:uncharacterized protein EURHEDRAFT_517023 [Aspergillus ruber CBS 135680]EYE93059.1 hypothetical protein EURHEDRAFT_517023 [Aspergillus ruber CBS 135680]
MNDPFVSNPADGTSPRESHRYSSFDTQLYSLNAASPAQAKRALEAHLAETERRLEEASKLGTTLIEQQRELEDKLKEVEQYDEGEIGPDLRRKLADLEREYNEIGRESARAFLAPKRMGADGHLGTPSADSKSPLTATMFADQGTNSPSKVSVPSRKQRNQPSNRVHDIEFATEISTSLLAQVRQLQALLAEREDALKTINLEKSRLELEAEGYAQRIRVLDESEERYKDENWALETRTQELMATIREAADRETKLNSNLSALTNDKGLVERELEDIKQTNARLIEDHMLAQKANDAEVHQLRRNLTSGDSERVAMQQKLEELNSQNEELAKAVAMRLRQHEENTRQVSQDNDSDDQGNETPDNSPPPSPNKFTPRHNQLETETLRSSLGHAHRMIQNLKSTIHREKTEKIELKRMLQDARDEVEQKRQAATTGGPSNKRQKTKPETLRKAPRPDLLGAGRKGKTEIEEVQESDWEDKSTTSSPPHKTPPGPVHSHPSERSSDEPSDYQTATEAYDSFDTANERETTTESEAFQTGVESMADSSGSDTEELTETEETVRRTPRNRSGRVSSLMMAKTRDRSPYHSTASTSTSEDEDAGFSSPTQNHTPSRHRLRMKRSVVRKIRPSGEAPMAFNSRPSSARNSPATSFVQEEPAPEGQSLFAELAELDGDESEETVDANFGQSTSFDATSQASTPRMGPAPDSRRPSEAVLDVPSKPTMVDSGVMTDPWEPTAVGAGTAAAAAAAAGAVGGAALGSAATASDSETTESKDIPAMANSATHGALDTDGEQTSANVQASDETATEAGELERSVSAPEPPQLELSSIATQETAPVAPAFPELSTSYVIGGTTDPVKPPVPEVPEMLVSSIHSQSTEPVEPLAPEMPEMLVSSIYSQSTEPIVARLPEPEIYVPEMAFSSIFSAATEPVLATLSEPEPPVSLADRGTGTDLPALSMSSVMSEQTEPISAKLPEPVPVPVPIEETTANYDNAEMAVSPISSESTEPEMPTKRDVPAVAIPELSFSTIRSVETSPIEFLPNGTAAAAPLMFDEENVPPVGSRYVSSGVMASEDDKPGSAVKATGERARPLSAISGNAMRTHRRTKSNLADQGAQTILSSKQIDQLLMDRVSTRPLSPPDSDRAKEMGVSPFATPKAKTRPTHRPSATSLPSGSRRPDSSASHVSSTHSHPPLPADHREAILAAGKSEQRPASPNVMGPPLAPASALRHHSTPNQRPRTPNDQGAQTSSSRTTSSRSKLRRESQGQVSRRSSVSSFASEIEERFNMYPNGIGAMPPHGYAEGTDPRMIQAITQTMIGEFLWKYTRKNISGEMSSTRHRRYFWVHPYTRTLYWSESDPQHAGKSELRTKSVPIEAVRVVADDNPYPPGLHCRSLEVVSPGRRVRFTATTSQRHETWFNALSYLLLRNSDENGEEPENSITLEDIDEFNPGFRTGSRQTQRMSFSSSQSRTLRNNPPPKQRAGSAMSMRQATTPGRASPALSAPSQSSPFLVPDQSRQGSSSRLSTIFNTTIKGSFGRKGRHGHSSSSVHDGSVHEHVHEHPSVDDLRETIEREDRETDGLENVRACCDGKHDVSALSRTSKYSPRANRIHSHH